MKRYGGHSMVADLKRVLVCTPETGGWGDARAADRWEKLGYRHRPDLETAAEQHRKLTEILEANGVEVIALPAGPGLSMDAVYAHDASFMTDFGAIVMDMGKLTRGAEAGHQEKFYEALDIPIFGIIEPPGTTEAGDMVWLDEKTLLVGRGFRTSEFGIEQLHAFFHPKGVEVISAHLPYGSGPSTCLHLMSLMSVLDERTVLVDKEWLSVPTVELVEGYEFQMIDIDTSERDTMACNVLALGGKRLVALEENPKTNTRLREHGFRVETFPGSELCQNGGGGPTCLTRPLLRET
jgi:N-dimethylarginine dimethylaminohydrolase